MDDIDPLGLGCILGIACGAQSAVANTLNPWSSSNPIRQWAASGSWSSAILKFNPALIAINGYASEAHAWEAGCSLWTVAMYGAEGAGGVALTGLVATGGALAVTGQSFGDVAYQSSLLGPDSFLFGNSTLGQTLRSGLLNPPGRGTWRLGWSVDRNIPGVRLKAAGLYHWLFHASGF